MSLRKNDSFNQKIKTKLEKLGFYYFTTFKIEPFKTLLNGSLVVPSGMMIHENNLLVFEIKDNIGEELEVLKKFRKLCKIFQLNQWSGNIYCASIYSECVKIYKFDLDSKSLILDNMKLENLLQKKFKKIDSNVEALIHSTHNFIISDLHTDDNSEMCLISLAVLLTAMKINIQTSSDDLIFETTKETIKNHIPDLISLISTLNSSNVSILAKRIYELYSIFGKDTYLKLYQDFCKYSKAKDEKNIVLTPNWIVRIMTNELRLSENTLKRRLNIFDPCVGTGSLILGSTHYGQTNESNSKESQVVLYGCEVNRKMYVLCKGLFMLSDSSYRVFHGDMFEMNFSQEFDGKTNKNSSRVFDRIITNPPYSKKLTGFHAIEFINYSIENFLKKNGILVAIFPTNQLKTIKQYQTYKEYIFNNCEILKIINLGRCFKNEAPTTDCSILVIQRTKKPNSGITRIYNAEFSTEMAYKVPHGELKFSDFGNELIEKIINNEPIPRNSIPTQIEEESTSETSNRIFQVSPESESKVYSVETRILSAEDDWTCQINYSDDIEKMKNVLIEEKMKESQESLIDYVHTHIQATEFDLNEMNQIIKDTRDYIRNLQLTMNPNDFHKCKISDLFELVSRHKTHIINNSNDSPGPYPLVSSSMKNNGVAKNINTFDFDGEYLVVSFAREPNTGFTSYHNEKFSVTSCVKILSPIQTPNLDSEDLKFIAKFMTIKFRGIYNRNHPLTSSKLLEETIFIRNNEDF
jgi:hypothetical protein